MNNGFAMKFAVSALTMALGCGVATAAPDQAGDSRIQTLLLADAQSTETKELDRISDEGLDTVQEVYAARLAIFEGQTKEAVKLIEKAQKSLKEAAADAAKIGITGKQGQVQLPIDARLTLADNFVLTPDKAQKIAKVDEHLKKGETKEASEILKEAGIYLNVSLALLPLETTQAALDKALKLVGEGHFYDANLVLKSIEDSIVIDSVSFSEWLEAAPTGKG